MVPKTSEQKVFSSLAFFFPSNFPCFFCLCRCFAQKPEKKVVLKKKYHIHTQGVKNHIHTLRTLRGWNGAQNGTLLMLHFKVLATFSPTHKTSVRGTVWLRSERALANYFLIGTTNTKPTVFLFASQLSVLLRYHHLNFNLSFTGTHKLWGFGARGRNKGN